MFIDARKLNARKSTQKSHTQEILQVLEMTENYTTGNQPSNGYSNFCRSKTSKLKIRPGAVTITKALAESRCHLIRESSCNDHAVRLPWTGPENDSKPV